MAKVLSHTSKAPFACAMSGCAAMSHTRSRGWTAFPPRSRRRLLHMRRGRHRSRPCPRASRVATFGQRNSATARVVGVAVVRNHDPEFAGSIQQHGDRRHADAQRRAASRLQCRDRGTQAIVGGVALTLGLVTGYALAAAPCWNVVAKCSGGVSAPVAGWVRRQRGRRWFRASRREPSCAHLAEGFLCCGEVVARIESSCALDMKPASKADGAR